jgi:hypothetical protein
MNDCRFSAAAFTKGWIGVQPPGKERLDNLAEKDRDESTSATNLCRKTDSRNFPNPLDEAL